MTIVEQNPLNLLSPIEYTFDLMGVNDNTVEKIFENGLHVNDSKFLKNIISTTNKSNTRFYLTDINFFKETFETSFEEFSSVIITTPLIYNGFYLNFKSFDTDFFALSGNYESYLKNGNAVLTKDKNLVSISLSTGNLATIYIEKDGYRFNLIGYDDGFCAFSTENEPTIFNFLYSLERNEMIFTANINSNTYFLTKEGIYLKLHVLNDTNKSFYLNNGFSISKSIYSTNSYPDNSNVIDYNLDSSLNNIENNKQNHLFFRTSDSVSILSLKNVINQNGSFSSTVNELSSNSKFKVSSLRKYTSINTDISRIEDNELSINYSYNNQEYLIKPGENILNTPKNMYPYEKININDTFFFICGSYANMSPLYSDIIYKYNENTITNDQHLLCTWLSGNSNNAVWVDRYYYPDIISKNQALSGNPIFYSTYDDEIENLILSNQNLKESIVKQLYFDKISDMCFEPNHVYIYDRINASRFTNLSSLQYNPCNIDDNYFKNINENGKFELSFYFNGDTETWSLSSKRNNINGGVEITKNIDNLHIFLNLYNPSNKTFEIFESVIDFKPYTTNFIAMSIDSLDGKGYFYLNDSVISLFQFEKAQYINKNILFGDFVWNGNLTNIRITPNYKKAEEISIYPIVDNILKIDDITISLPCNHRNSLDVIELIQNVCDSSAHKSNSIDINIKNVSLNKEDSETLKQGIYKKAMENLPITTIIQNIDI